MTTREADRLAVFSSAADARENGADGEFIGYLVDACCDQIDSRGYLPDSDEARALFALAKENER